MPTGKELPQLLIDGAGLSRWAASKAMGRAGSYVDTVIRTGRVPSLDVAAALADVCGFDLVAVSRETGERLRVEPPTSGGPDGQSAPR